jgi:DNA-binding MarR family transcriptional regulator
MDSLEAQAERLESLLPSIARALSLPQEIDPLADLTPAQLRFARAIRTESRTLTDVSLELNMSLSASTQLVQRLEEAGIVVRSLDPHDRRIRRVALTEIGLAKLEARRCLRLRNARQLLSRIPSDEREGILSALDRLTVPLGLNTECRPGSSSPRRPAPSK